MVWRVARFLTILGFLLFLAALFWSTAYVNLPDLDATAEMISEYQHNERIALRVMQIGIALSCAGGLTRIVAKVLDQKK
jgi:hypothetical protein